MTRIDFDRIVFKRIDFV